MTTSSGNFPRRPTKVDALTLPDHWYLDESDTCYFLGHYTARAGYEHSQTNSLISNLKKDMSRRGTPEWRYKLQAIEQAAEGFRRCFTPQALDSVTFVPVPPSKIRDDDLYDDRMTQVLKRMRPHPAVDVRELIVQTRSTEAAHGSPTRPSPAQIEALYTIDERRTNPKPQRIIVADDILTTGAHFKAATDLLTTRFPGVPVFGLFIARRVPEADD